MITLSLCMIVKDEEAVIGRCLGSVTGLFDEIIVVDTGSTDATKEIVATFGCKQYNFTWVDDFAAARNFSFSHATSQYIMWLDADDVLLEQDLQKFMEIKKTLDPSVDVVMAKYNTAFDENGQPTFSYNRERIVRNTPAYRWVGAVHEVIAPIGKILYTDASVTHVKLSAPDPQRNLRIFEAMIARGEVLDPRLQYYYARELRTHKHYNEAIAVLTTFLNDGRGWIENNIAACMDLHSCYIATNARALGLQALLRSFVYDTPRAEVCCALGEHFIQEAAYTQAIYWYLAAAAQEPNEQSSAFIQRDCYNFVPYLKLCVCYDKIGNAQQAVLYHNKAKMVRPTHPSVVYNEEYFKNITV